MLALFSFFSKKNDEELEIIQFVQSSLGYTPKNLQLFRKALTHKSIAHNSDEISNERLEFLGDAILDAVIAEMLFNRYPD